jgi:hypothetical protein
LKTEKMSQSKSTKKNNNQTNNNSGSIPIAATTAPMAPIIVEGIPANTTGDIGQIIPTARSKKTTSRREQHNKMTAMAVDVATHAIEGMTIEDSARITPPVFNVINIDFANQDHF